MRILILAAALLAAIVPFDACKKAEMETGTLRVILSAGVSGTPAAGSYTVRVGDEWTYAYTLDDGYDKLTVLLDGEEVDASGTLTVTGDHTLQAYSDDNRQYTLSVTVGTGVTGTPATGTYTYLKGTQVSYSYALVEGYTKMSVKLNAAEVAGSGTITMSQDYALYVTAEVKYDVRGSWTLSESYNDDSSFKVTATFSGGMTAGTVTDSEGGSGTYTYTEDTVKFTLVFPDVTYEYSGEFSDADKLGGTCKRYRTSDNVISGTWSATRVKTTTARPLPASASKGRFRRE